MKKISAKTLMILAGCITAFAFLTFFLPPLVGIKTNYMFYKVYFPNGYYHGAIGSLIAYLMILGAATLFFLSAFVFNKNERLYCLIAVLLLIVACVLLYFTPQFYVNSLWAPDYVTPETVASAKAEQLSTTSLGIGVISGMAISLVSALAGAWCVRELKGK